MYVDRNALDLYPYWGKFTRIGIDDSLPLDEQVETEIVVLETRCDITENSHSYSKNFISAKFVAYIPTDWESKATTEIRAGDLFIADVHGISVNGKVVGVFPSQLNGIVVYIQDSDV